MKILKLICLAAAPLIMAQQTTRFIYQVTMKPDSLDRADAKTERAFLDVSPGKSIFYSENRMKRDSIMQKMRQTQTFDRSLLENTRSNIDYVVEKDLANHKITYKSRIARDQYAYEEDRPMNWKILPETAKIGDYKTQKAETVFGGRTWDAWFTTDIPFPDGPYKFSGLPGLIIKVEDAKGDYSFDLMQSKKIEEPGAFESRGNIVKLKRADYDKQYAKFLKDPASFMNNNGNMAPPQGAGPRGGNRGGFGGTPPDPNQRKEMEKRMVDNLKKNNNPIELPAK